MPVEFAGKQPGEHAGQQGPNDGDHRKQPEEQGRRFHAKDLGLMLQHLDGFDEQVASDAHEEPDAGGHDQHPPFATEAEAGGGTKNEVPESGGHAASVSWQGPESGPNLARRTNSQPR